ncbi:MAG: DNA-directed RNA polymerase, subunit E'' [Euryarchaeota archaeon]|nr:DNA-directed RNA polymerase, subunit E'' [Euryarchaeota archaeon]
MAQKEKACRNCRRIIKGDVCPICKSTTLTDDWSGYLIIVDPNTSEIAKTMRINVPGKYALRVR